MQLQNLHIYKNYGDDSYRCNAEFTGESGKIQLSLRPELSRHILAVCADEIVEASKAAAKNMTAEILQGQIAAPIAGE